MHWTDRVYGEVTIDNPDLLALIGCSTFQRLRGIRQAGPSAIAFPFKTVTRFEHSLGVYLLLRRLGVDRQQQVAGLIHDISHTAFSHAVDFLFHSDEQDYHEKLKPEFLHRPDLQRAIQRLGYAPEAFYDDAVYPILERPLPFLCADRLDYFLRDSLVCGVSTPESVARTLAHATTIQDHIVLTDIDVARDTVERFAEMNRNFWAGSTESFIYNAFADALREALRIGAIREADLLRDDAHVLSRLQSSGNSRIAEAMEHIKAFQPDLLRGFVPRVSPKNRWLDPLVCIQGQIWPFSQLEPASRR